MVDVALIVIAAVVPFILLFFNLIVMGRYLDSTATKGHYIAKLMIVRLLTAPQLACTLALPPEHGCFT
jgi:hypothetical protein